uniref:Synaptic vesicular acetylcholine transporter n=1 Tax=Meara stichopi TaxID=84115 RepID=A0A2P1DVE5_9BILA|nr:synaptic vesicular acetylcholine transporter [Meara stichopi]
MENAQLHAKEKLDIFKQRIYERTNSPDSQKKLALCVVCVALLLDNMLYMVIVPIIPYYLHKGTIEVRNGTEVNDEFTGGETASIGILFASKAIVQLIFNPISGTLIDRRGYELPMVFGLCMIFASTITFAFGESYLILFIARSLQGLGSAFADSSGYAMIADRFSEEKERNKALGIALAFVSFGCLFAPPFGGFLYELAGKELPFIFLALLALADAAVIKYLIKPFTHIQEASTVTVPIHRLFLDKYIAIISGALAISNISLAFIEPTIAIWMKETMGTNGWQVGIVWLPGFLPHILGVYLCVVLANKYPKTQWMYAGVGLVIIGISCCVLPASKSFGVLVFPIMGICFGIALVDTSLIPALSYIMDVRYVSVYGSVYAIADISYSVAYAIGPIIAGAIVHAITYLWMCELIGFITIGFAPLILGLKKIYDLSTAMQEKQTLLDEPAKGLYTEYGISAMPDTVYPPVVSEQYELTAQNLSATVANGQSANNGSAMHSGSQITTGNRRQWEQFGGEGLR